MLPKQFNRKSIIPEGEPSLQTNKPSMAVAMLTKQFNWESIISEGEPSLQTNKPPMAEKKSCLAAFDLIILGGDLGI